ncbi:MAG: hypothetical protein LKI30_05160 [Bifidobacterium crudilactis]|jgi:hypothetical protein|nr:hypothetical protein [Bifidobacterium crudilactis]
MRRPTVRPIRVESFLLPDLRKAFPDVVFSTVRSSTEFPYRECVLVAEPGQLVTPITQYVTLRLSVYVVSESGAADWKAAQELAADIESHILSTDYAKVIDSEHSSGPMRALDDESKILFAYSLVLLNVLVR